MDRHRTGQAVRVALSLLVALAACSDAEPVDEEAQIRAAYTNWRSAVLDQDGARAATFVSQNTADYFENLRETAVLGSAETVKALGFFDKLYVLMMRHRIPAQTLRDIKDGRALYAYMVNQDWIGGDGLKASTLGEISVTGTSATGEHVYRGKTSDFRNHFAFNGERWQIDPAALYPVTSRMLERQIKNSDEDVDAYIFAELEKVSGKPVPDDIWSPR